MENISVKMPRLGVNDDRVILVEWLVENGAPVKCGQNIASIESTKETSEIKAEEDGYLFYTVRNGESIDVGETVAIISESSDFHFEEVQKESTKQRITDKAMALIKKYNVDISSLSELRVIREKDIKDLVENNDAIEVSKANAVIVVNGGGLAKMCIDLLMLNKAYNIHGITNPLPTYGSSDWGIPYLGTDDELKRLREEGYMAAVNAVGSITSRNTSEYFYMRKKQFELIKSYGFYLPTLIHPSAQISNSARLGEGVLVFENATIASGAVIGDDCLINTGSIISHDCKIAKHTRISPGAILAGKVTVGENTLIGMGVNIYMDVHIGKNVIIANGKNIVNDVPDDAVII